TRYRPRRRLASRRSSRPTASSSSRVIEASSVAAPGCKSRDWAIWESRWPAPMTVFFSRRSCSSEGGVSGIANQCCGQLGGQDRVAFQQGGVGLDHPVTQAGPPGGLQPGQLGGGSVWPALSASRVRGEFGQRNGEVARERLADDQSGPA